jgi:hypothetical protein
MAVHDLATNIAQRVEEKKLAAQPAGTSAR